jgi:hypothetical protein
VVAILPIISQAFSGLVVFFGYTVYFFQQAGFADPFKQISSLRVFSWLELLLRSSYSTLSVVARYS